MTRPVVAVTAGDPAGVGPELAARIAGDRDVRRRCRLVVIGDPDVVGEGARVAGARLEVRELASLDAATFDPDAVEVLVPVGGRVDGVRPGVGDETTGRAALRSLEVAAELARAGTIDALLSAPVSKHALHLAGLRQVDEIALLAELTSRPAPLLVGVLDGLLTACVTLHVPLRDVPALVTRGRVLETAHAFLAVLRRVAPSPRLVVAGLNPHAGDGGLLGREELDEIGPALDELRRGGAGVVGPVAPDAAFPYAKAHGGDGVLCMYHDQANIARKLAGIRGATLLVGLPVPVATTAHGTAFDIAGTGRADATSIRLALDRLLDLAGGA